MRRRDFAIALLLAPTTRSVRGEEQAAQRRIAIVIPAGPVTGINETGVRAWQAFFDELRRLGDMGGKTSRSTAIRARGGLRAIPISFVRWSAGTRT